VSIPTYPNVPAVFDGNDINAIDGVSVISTNPYVPPKRNVDSEDVIRTDKSNHTGAFYSERLITVTVAISKASRALMEQSLDALMNILQGTQKILALPQAGTTRNYYCTLQDTMPNDQALGGSFLQLDLIFECSDRFGYETVANTLLSMSAFTSSYRSDRLTFRGSAKWQVPVIHFTYTAIGGGTNATVRVGNGNTGQEMSLTRTWVAGDAVEVDVYNNKVKVNGVETDVVGAIPQFGTGFQYWYYSDNFTSRTFTGDITCVFRYV
jgi:hypothetical protein